MISQAGRINSDLQRRLTLQRLNDLAGLVAGKRKAGGARIQLHTMQQKT
jgi:hypothetical protein